MNEVDKNAIVFIARAYKHMRININTFTDIMQEWDGAFKNLYQPITESKLLKTGHYADIGACKCWVSKEVAPNHICVSNDIFTGKNIFGNINWSPPVLLKYATEIDRLMNLKAFW